MSKPEAEKDFDAPWNELVKTDEFISNFKSMYYMLNATPDTQMKVFNENRLIELNDLHMLDKKIEEKLKNHDIITNKTSVYISFDDGRNEELSFPEFERKDWSIPSTTKSINMQWNFNIKLPRYDFPQKHSLTVRMGSTLRPDEYFKIMLESESDSKVNSILADVVCRVDFVNAVLSDELINIVEEWYQSLQINDKTSKLSFFYNRHAKKLSRLIELLFPIIAVLGIYGWTSRYLNIQDTLHMKTNEQLNKILLWLTITIIIIFASRFLGLMLASLNFQKAKTFTGYSHLLFTKGDVNKRRESDQKNKSLLKDITVHIAGTVVFTIISLIWGVLM